jgi:acyl-CoA-dependent ceramide synthase
LEIVELAPNATPSSQFATVGPYELNWETQQYKCWISQWITFGLLAALQSVNIFWLVLILRILWRVVKTLGQVREDERSEYDSEDEEEEQLRREELKMGKEREDAIGVSDGEEAVPEVLVNGEPVGVEKGLEVKKA